MDSSAPRPSRRLSLESTSTYGSSSSSTCSDQKVRVSPPSSKRLRSGLLNKLGIVDQRVAAATSSSAKGGSVLRQITVVKAPLKDVAKGAANSGDPKGKPAAFLDSLGSFFKVGSPSSVSTSTELTDDMSSTCSSLDASPTQRPRRCLTFDEQVSVVHIPRREQYSSRIQQHLWHSSGHLRDCAMRNTIEFAADGWKWQNVREEDQHSVCPQSGELIHPVHSEIARLIRQEQGLPQDTPVWTPFWKHTPISGQAAAPPTPQETGLPIDS
ncbi:expressed unknown protein [Seminavis robusta]|uniref:Uncharacterized protein n=1 Tax=Seminavis robusta TaxID=568900 RepID=A0A9N8E493_9STRA|nr:expressed unknown protein [Seminavis robusta]|eukprot:Sro633_g178760.1 n/a (269) ;mRNA; r:12434-13240